MELDPNGGVLKCPSCKKHKKEVERIDGMGKTWCYKCQAVILKADVDVGKEHPDVLVEFKRKHGLK